MDLSTQAEIEREQEPALSSPLEGATGEIPFFTARRMLQTALIVVALVVAIYLLVPKLVGLQSAIAKLGDGDPLWIALAVLFNLAAYAAFVALFKGVVGGEVLPLAWSESYQITMAGLAATRLFSAGGAGGILLNYWALRKAGMGTRQAASRMVAFLVLLYSVYAVAVIIFGVLLRTGVLAGSAPLALTIIPAAIAAIVLAAGLLVTLVPGDLERRLASSRKSSRAARFKQWLAKVPATAARGVRSAAALFDEPSQGALALAGAIGYWAANIAILWASFEAFGQAVPFAVLVQGFFVGMAANLFPFAPGGVGAVDAGMIGAFALFGLPGTTVFAAVLTYRVIAFWLPIPPGIAAYFQLRHTVSRWEHDGRPIGRRLRAGANTLQSEV